MNQLSFCTQDLLYLLLHSWGVDTEYVVDWHFLFLIFYINLCNLSHNIDHFFIHVTHTYILNWVWHYEWLCLNQVSLKPRYLRYLLSEKHYKSHQKFLFWAWSNFPCRKVGHLRKIRSHFTLLDYTCLWNANPTLSLTPLCTWMVSNE